MTRATSRSARLFGGGAGLLLLAAHAHGATPLAGAPASPAPPVDAALSSQQCLPGERGFLQATLRGALATTLDWRGASLSCQGSERSAERGVRLSLQGATTGSGEPLRINIGLAAAPGRSVPGTTPASVTVIVEGAQRIYASGDDTHCAVEALRQEPLPAAVTAPGTHAWRIAGRGWCIDPLPALHASGAAAGERLYVDRFDFAAIAHFATEPLHADDAH